MKYVFNDERSPLRLFSDGDAVRAYDFLGAHFINLDGRNGVIFRVWAPNAITVSLVGDFNNWNQKANYMYKIGGGVWELFIENLNEFAVYKFCIETVDHTNILKSDPFAFHCQTRPENASMVFNTNQYVWHDSYWMENRQNTSSPDKPMNIYEIHAGSWKKYPDGNYFNYQKMADELIPYLKEMNYTHVQLMPLMEYPYDPSWAIRQQDTLPQPLVTVRLVTLWLSLTAVIWRESALSWKLYRQTFLRTITDFINLTAPAFMRTTILKKVSVTVGALASLISSAMR